MPDWKIEDGHRGLICGIDEAGRGPWAGPVVAGAAVFLTREVSPELLAQLNDSKKLSAKKRKYLYELLRQEEQAGHILCGIGEASAAEIDELNILQATFMAMRRAVENLPQKPDIALIDGNRLPKDFPCANECFIGGDGRSYSIAAASILAKVYRDRLMSEMAKQYPHYGFEKNAGYGTKAHIEGLRQYGVTPQHRRSYRPIKEFLATGK